MEQHELNRKRLWTSEEDNKLQNYVNMNGDRHWDTMARNLNLGRSGNSCRYRWVHYLSRSNPRGPFTDEEMLLILNLHFMLGNQWSKIAQQLPGRTDNDIKNFWNTRVKKEAKNLNCEFESEVFLNKMTAILRGRIETAAGADGGTTDDHAHLMGGGGGGGGTAATILTASSSTGSSYIVADYSDDSLSAQDLANQDSVWVTLEADRPHLFTPVPPLAVAGGSGSSTASTGPTGCHPNIDAEDCSEDFWSNLDSIWAIDEPPSFDDMV